MITLSFNSALVLGCHSNLLTNCTVSKNSKYLYPRLNRKAPPSQNRIPSVTHASFRERPANQELQETVRANLRTAPRGRVKGGTQHASSMTASGEVPAGPMKLLTGSPCPPLPPHSHYLPPSQNELAVPRTCQGPSGSAPLHLRFSAQSLFLLLPIDG